MAQDLQEELENLGRRLEHRGYRFRRMPYFGPHGIFVYTPPVRGCGDLTVIERTVCLYPCGGNWEAMVTLHGGKQWFRQAETLEVLEEIAVEALSTSERPPSGEWRTKREEE